MFNTYEICAIEISGKDVLRKRNLVRPAEKRYNVYKCSPWNQITKGEKKIMAFVHLHTHTEYSLLDGSNKIKEYVSRVKELGMNSAAITDHGNMYGVWNFTRPQRQQILIR